MRLEFTGRHVTITPARGGDVAAALDVGAGPGAFLVFRNAAADAVAVLFRRPDGYLGHLEPDA